MFKQLFTEDLDRGVSPVIGVILMVAITVILAAVIGAFVLGLGDQVSNNAPQASFEFDFGNGNATVTHGGGDDIDSTTIQVTVSGEEAYPSAPGTGDGPNSTGWSTDPISTGDEVIIYNSWANGSYNDTDLTDGETIRIVWNNPSGGSSNTIGEREIPA